MIDARKEMMFDLKVQAPSRKEPEQRVGSKSVARRDLVLVPIERAFLSIHVLVGNMVQLTGDGEGDTEYRVWKEAPYDGFEPTKVWHEERPEKEHGEGKNSANDMNDLSTEAAILHLDVFVLSCPEEESVLDEGEKEGDVHPDDGDVVHLPNEPALMLAR